MAMDMVFNIDKCEGESAKQKDGIDVLAFSWGVSQSGTLHTGDGGGSGMCNVQDLSFTKYIDKASTNLMLHCAQGDHLDKAVLTIRKAGGSTPLEYLKITLEPVLITSISTGGSGSEDRMTENVSLNFGKFEVEYQNQDTKGTGKGKYNVAWDIAKREKK